MYPYRVAGAGGLLLRELARARQRPHLGDLRGRQLRLHRLDIRDDLREHGDVTITARDRREHLFHTSHCGEGLRH